MTKLTIIIDLEQVEKDHGRVFIEEDKALALDIIPEGFTEALFNARPTEFIILKNPSQAFGLRMAEETFKIFSLGGDRVVRVSNSCQWMLALRTCVVHKELHL
ncbi:MAG: hypothetical protein JW882_02235 [Deltaproteobacteria bacterium]|nr:hypothetical protein [Deltaproteobacteria bacterium]